MAASVVVCAACMGENAPGARFCAECGAPQGFPPETRRRDRAERRQLTVMFCDLVGSSELSRRLDLEEYRELVRAYQLVCQETLERFDGHVAQYLGDGVLAYFGYPHGHEDNAERAVRAGLELLSELARMNDERAPTAPVRLRARIGVHTGPVVVGEIGTGARRETLALGETTNVAARIQAVAEADTLAISETTLRLVGGLFLTEHLGSPGLKGVAGPLRVYRVLHSSGVRSRLDVPGRRTPLVGREAELSFLRERWERAQGGAGQAVQVVGEAGLGKSRLVARLRQSLGGLPHSWLECRCSPFATSSALHPVLELVREACRFEEADAPEDKRRKLEEALELYGFDLDATLPGFAQLLALPLDERCRAPAADPQRVRSHVLETLVDWSLAIAAQQPTVVLFEDLHWSDPTTQELVMRILARCAEAPMLALLTLRSDVGAPWVDLPHVARLELARLSEEQARELASQASGGALPAAALDQVVERADGNPLFVEELVRLAVETQSAPGSRPPTVPPSIQDSLTARLDGVGEARELAQLAAALGRDFSYAMLAAVAERDEARLRSELARLTEADLLYQRGEPPRAEYGFRHVLLQETAYQSLLRSQRGRIHARIASVLEQRFPELAREQPESLAHHWMEAGAWERALEGFAGAGRIAALQAAYVEAASHYRRALEALAQLPGGPHRDRRELPLQLMLGNVTMAAEGYSAPGARAAFERAVELAEAFGDAAELSSAVTGLTAWWNSAGHCREALRHARRTLEIASRSKLRVAALRGHTSLALIQLYLGAPSRALRHAERAMAIYEPGDYDAASYGIGSDQGVLSHGVAAMALFLLGRFDRALAMAREGVALAEQLDAPLSLAMARFFLGMVHHARGESERAVDQAGRVIEVAQSFGFPDWLGFGMLLDGVERTHLAEESDGVEEATEGIERLARTGNRGGAPFGFGLLAEAQIRAGRLAEALATVEGGLALSAETDQPVADADLLRMKGELLLARDRGARSVAERLLREAVRTARRRREHAFDLRATTSLARLLRDDGRGEEARALLRDTCASFHEGLATGDLRRAHALLAALG